ncbi:MAG: FHA domain-containing protein [Planctomycetaceae bacterium]|nr:FHA domain-containing protein [Planctomycetaceae bacterium]
MFHILTGKHKGKTLTLPDKAVVVIGRDPDVDIRVNSTEVSRQHCEIRSQDEEVFIKDLGSRNGTFLNGEAIYGEVPMQPGDTLHVGTMVFELCGKKKKVEESPPRPRKPPASRAALKAPSEEDVYDWLSDDSDFHDSDTTIVTNADAQKMGLDETTPLVPRVSTLRIQPVDPGTEAAEAAEIIRRYWAEK